jgi:hypothetical protein
VRWLRHGGAEMLSIQAASPYAPPGRVTIQFAEPVALTDLRAGGTRPRAKEATIELDPFEPTIFSLAR